MGKIEELALDERPLLLRSFDLSLQLERPPVWLMRQAGRYLKEYRMLKEKHSFLELCHSHELALEVSLQPIHALDVDAAIVFADILLPLEGMGFHVDFNPGPKISNPIIDVSDIYHLKPEVGKAERNVPTVIRSLRNAFSSHHAFSSHREKNNSIPRKAVIGFAGSPWTLACYALRQEPFKQFLGTLVFAKLYPRAFSLLLEKLTAVTITYLLAQREAGADALQLFDSWGGLLSEEDYKQYSLPYIQQIVEALRPTGCPLILYVGNSHHLLNILADSSAQAISVDWRTPLQQSKFFLSKGIAVQGNLPPTDLFLPESEVYSRTRAMITSWSSKTGLIANLGHGVLPHTPRESVVSFVQAVKAGWS